MISAAAQTSLIGWNICRIEAINAFDLRDNSKFLTKGALACWQSHRLAMENLIQSDFNFALILEDDFSIKDFSKLKRLLGDPQIFDNVDVFQIGYLVNDYKERVDLIFRNLENWFFSFISLINFNFLGTTITFRDRVRVKRKFERPINWVADDFRSGAHAYLISRGAAEKILKLNHPPFLTTDAFFVSLNSGRAFRVYRRRKSLIGQLMSESSIKNWGVEIAAGDTN